MRFLTYFFALVCSIFLLTGCSKDKDNQAPAQVDKGTISGKALPFKALYKVRATSVSDSADVFFASPDSSGKFVLKGLPVGKYHVGFVPRPGYGVPANMLNVPVYRNSDNDLGEFVLERAATIKFMVDNVEYTAVRNKISSFKQGNYYYFKTGDITKGNKTVSLEFYIKNFAGKGTYPLVASPNWSSFCSYYENGTKYQSNSGSLIISEFDITHEIINGTFSFEAEGKEIKNGVFTEVYSKVF